MSLAQFTVWHARNKSEYGFVQIPTYSKAMKHIDEKWLGKIKYEPCSIRFGL
jgi:hypothetical protein